MGERIKELRKALGLTQEAFAKKIGLTQNTITRVETGSRGLSSSAISVICHEFGVSERWLRTGAGEMFVDMDADTRIATFFADVLRDEPDSFRKRLVSMLAKLDARDWEDLTRMAKKMLEED